MKGTYHGNSWAAASAIASEERHRREIALVQQHMIIRESLAASGAGVAPPPTIRQTLGAWLVRFGGRLQGADFRSANLEPVLGR